MKSFTTLKPILISLSAAFILMLSLNQKSLAQALDYDNKISVTIEDTEGGDMNVTLYGKAGSSKTEYEEIPQADGSTKKKFKARNRELSKEYYYLPPNNSLKVGRKPDGTPEFLFMKYTTEETVEAGGVSGAIIHFLMEWGLTKDQEEDLQEAVEDLIAGAKVMGPVELTLPSAGDSFNIVSATLSDEGFAPKLVTSGKAPIVAGGKAAVAARLDKYGAQLLAATFEETSSITDISLALDYEYEVLTPAVKGFIRYDWTRFEEISESMAIDYIKQELDGDDAAMQKAMDAYATLNDTSACGGASQPNGMQKLVNGMKAADQAIGDNWWNAEYYVGESQLRKLYSLMQENEVIVMEWEELVSDERIDVIREAFFDYFLNAFTAPAPAEVMEAPGGFMLEAPDMEEVRKMTEGVYQFNSCAQMESHMERTREIRLDNIRLPIRKSHQLVNNLAREYDMARDNPKCVGSINLNDPFFSHRDIRVVLDLDTRDLFDKEINHASVTIRKKRDTGNDFLETVVFDSESIKDLGVVQTVTYSKATESQGGGSSGGSGWGGSGSRGGNNAETYEYKTQWSLRGGYNYDEHDRWQRGDWAGLNLAPPVKPRYVEVESDIEDLKTNSITRMTLQVRYLKFGEECETNIHVSPAKGEALVGRTVFVDNDTRGYAYRLIVNHKTKGKLAFPWQSKINDDYVYASIPEQMYEIEEPENKSWLEEAAETAKTTTSIVTEVLDAAGELKAELINVFK